MKVYTRTGDAGTTSLVGGTRVAKDDARLDAYGTIDEVNSWLGLLQATGLPDAATGRFVTALQNKLFDLGAALATEKDSAWTPAQVSSADTAALESEIDRLEEMLPRHNRFVLPGGSPAAAIANVARTVCRRAERTMASMPADSCPGQAEALRFVNRLSDYLFVLGRYCNHATGHAETYWEQGTTL